MKSGVAAMLMAMVELKRSGASFAGEIQLQAVADEETGSQWGTLYLIEQGYCDGADFAICTEPTSNRVELGNRGLRWIDVTVTWGRLSCRTATAGRQRRCGCRRDYRADSGAGVRSA